MRGRGWKTATDLGETEGGFPNVETSYWAESDTGYPLHDLYQGNLPRLVASVQASEGSPLYDPEVLLRLARASVSQGIGILRLEGVETIKRIRSETGAKIIGLIKRRYKGSEVYITPTRHEVELLIQTGCEVIALDATNRPRPDGSTVEELISLITQAGRVAMADCDTAMCAVAAFEAGADVVGTTLAGYTSNREKIAGPDLELVREIKLAVEKAEDRENRKRGHDSQEWDWRTCDVLAEGRYEHRWQIEAALRIGADAVVVGGALNDPVKNTVRLMPRQVANLGSVAAIDIGGTWLRAARVGLGEWAPVRTLDISRTPLPSTRAEKMEWISRFLQDGNFERVGISTGGIVKDNVVTVSKPTIPENVGTDFNTLRDCLVGDDPIGVIALDDGHASAWAHACHPDFAGKNVAVLAIGTGVGFGFVREGKILMGPNGEYTRLNDLPGPDGRRYEELLGGAALTPKPTKRQKSDANKAVQHALAMIATFLFPDVIVLCGTVGMQPWLDLEMPQREGFPDVPVVRSPFVADAGIYGAEAIALFPPPFVDG